MLGEQVVDYGRRADNDRINVGRYEGRFSKLTVVVLDSDLELLDFTVNFPRGTAYKPAVNHYFRRSPAGDRIRISQSSLQRRDGFRFAEQSERKGRRASDFKDGILKPRDEALDGQRIADPPRRDCGAPPN